MRKKSEEYFISKSRMKKSSSVDMLTALAKSKSEHAEDATTCTAPCSESERTSHHSSKNACDDPQRRVNVVSGDEEDCGTHEAIIQHIYEDVDPNGDPHQVLLDIPTCIISSLNTINRKDGDGNDSVSSLGLDSLLNDNPRSIFSMYWNGMDAKDIPSTVLSRSSSCCTNELSASYSSTSMYSKLTETVPQDTKMETEAHHPEECYQEYNAHKPSRKVTSRFSSSESHKEDYEMILRRHEIGHTTVLRAAFLNEDKITDCTNNDAMINQEMKQPIHDISRRSIFSHIYSKSKYEYPSYRYSGDHIFSVSSTSALLPPNTRNLERRSCLRPLGRSLSAFVRSESSGKVTFDPKVRVLEYGHPGNNNGWSKWFV